MAAAEERNTETAEEQEGTEQTPEQFLEDKIIIIPVSW